MSQYTYFSKAVLRMLTISERPLYSAKLVASFKPVSPLGCDIIALTLSLWPPVLA